MDYSTQAMLADAIILAFFAAAAFLDLRTKRIPNKLTYSGVLVGLLAGPLLDGIPWGGGLFGALAAFAFLMIFWRAGMIGGGDVKLSMVVGAFKGWFFLLNFFFYVFSGCFVLIVFSVVARVGLVRGGAYLLNTLRAILLMRPMAEPPVEIQGLRFPFAVVALIALLLTLTLERTRHLVGPF